MRQRVLWIVRSECINRLTQTTHALPAQAQQVLPRRAVSPGARVLVRTLRVDLDR